MFLWPPQWHIGPWLSQPIKLHCGNGVVSEYPPWEQFFRNFSARKVHPILICHDLESVGPKQETRLCEGEEMKIAVDVLGSVKEPYLEVRYKHTIDMPLRPGFVEVGRRRSEIRQVKFDAGEVGLCTPHIEHWLGNSDMQRLSFCISDAALMAAADSAVELSPKCMLADTRISALLASVNAERIAGFPSGPLFLDSIEQALALALVSNHSVRGRSVEAYRGGLAPARLRRVVELIHSRIEDDVSLDELAKSAGLSITHFSEMFRKSTGHSPHQFVLRQKVERAKQLLRAAEVRVLDVAIACGFKTQQHFARVFRRVCGVSPREYQQEFLA